MLRRNRKEQFTDEELAQWEVYGRRLNRETVMPNLKPTQHGFWAIMDLYTRDYEAGRVFDCTLRDLRNRRPDAFVWIERVDIQ